MSSYSSLLRAPGVARIIAAQLTARFPYGTLSLSLLLYIQARTGSYAAAGLVLGSCSVLQAISGPLSSRLMGRFGIGRVLSISIAICSVTLIATALLNLPLWGYMALGGLIGTTTPGVQSAVRTIYPGMVKGQLLTRLYTLDATVQELIWIIGPVLTTFVAAAWSPWAALMMTAVIMVAGGAWFVLSPEVRRATLPRSRTAFGRVLGRPPVLLATMVGLLLVGSSASIEVSVVASLGRTSAETGIVLALWSVGSMVGGVLVGGLTITPWSLTRRMLVLFTGVALALAVQGFWGLAIVLFISGLGMAPALGVVYSMISASVRLSETAEAYGWLGTGMLVGAAAGSAVSGFAIDHMGALGGFMVSTSFALAGVIVPALARQHAPDLRFGDASPHPETAPVAAHSVPPVPGD